MAASYHGGDEGELGAHVAQLRVSLGVQIRGGAHEDGDVLTRAADQRVAEVAEQAAHTARRVVVVHHQLLIRCAADGTAAFLAREHRGVLFEGDAVVVFQIRISPPLQI